MTASTAYDAMNALLEALKNNNKTASEIKNYILNNELNSATWGKFRFNADGSVPSEVEIIEHGFSN